MTASTPGHRPSIHAILTGQDLQGGSHSTMSEREVANLLAAMAGVPSSMLYVGMKAGFSLGSALGLKSRKRRERRFFAPYVPTVLAVVLARELRGVSGQRLLGKREGFPGNRPGRFGHSSCSHGT